MSRRRVVLGVIAFIVAMTGAVVRPWEDRSGKEILATDQPAVVGSGGALQPSTTTVTATTIVVVNGVPFPVPIPSLPPGVSIDPPPEGGVVNIHCRVESINGPAQFPQDPWCGRYNTTTTRP